MSAQENHAFSPATQPASAQRHHRVLPRASALALACSAALAFSAQAQQAQPA